MRTYNIWFMENQRQLYQNHHPILLLHNPSEQTVLTVCLFAYSIMTIYPILKFKFMKFLTCAPNEDSNQPAHPRCPIRVFIVRMKKLCVLGYPKCAQRKVWSEFQKVRLQTLRLILFELNGYTCLVLAYILASIKIAELMSIVLIWASTWLALIEDGFFFLNTESECQMWHANQ